MALGTQPVSLSGFALNALVEGSYHPENSEPIIQNLQLLLGTLNRKEGPSIARNVFLILNNLFRLSPKGVLLRAESLPVLLIGLLREHERPSNKLTNEERAALFAKGENPDADPVGGQIISMLGEIVAHCPLDKEDPLRKQFLALNAIPLLAKQVNHRNIQSYSSYSKLFAFLAKGREGADALLAEQANCKQQVNQFAEGIIDRLCMKLSYRMKTPELFTPIEQTLMYIANRFLEKYEQDAALFASEEPLSTLSSIISTLFERIFNRKSQNSELVAFFNRFCTHKQMIPTLVKHCAFELFTDLVCPFGERACNFQGILI